jgi:hypothetical protein
LEAADLACRDMVRDYSPKKRADDPALRAKISDLYKDRCAKRTLLSFFHNKCAYCESPLTMKSCDVEHFRPKGRVSTENNKPVGRTVGGKFEKHPGYYWLAYDWGNLLPSCVSCNRFGEAYGKWDRFPVRGQHAFEPGQEQFEEPLLINPWWQCPDRHFIFASNGAIAGMTEEGKKCVEIFGLKRDPLLEGRKTAWMQARGAIKSMFEAINYRALDEVRQHKADVDAYLQGRKPYSAAGRASIFQYKKEIEEGSEGFLKVVLDYVQNMGSSCYCRSVAPLAPPTEDDLGPGGLPLAGEADA